MSDLVERLRECANKNGADYRLTIEAADMLERQQRQIEAVTMCHGDVNKLLWAAIAEQDEKQQRIEKLEAALAGIAETSSSADTRDIAEAALTERNKDEH